MHTGVLSFLYFRHLKELKHHFCAYFYNTLVFQYNSIHSMHIVCRHGSFTTLTKMCCKQKCHFKRH